jgi:hypothetical protein
VKRLREAVGSLGTPAEFYKLQAVLKALELQVDDGHYERHAVTYARLVAFLDDYGIDLVR